jgi:hypothetical protein
VVWGVCCGLCGLGCVFWFVWCRLCDLGCVVWPVLVTVTKLTLPRPRYCGNARERFQWTGSTMVFWLLRSIGEWSTRWARAFGELVH